MRVLLNNEINSPRLFPLQYYSQAYAELETDTPGQICGVTYKTDGKSSSWTSSSSTTRRQTAENISEEFTQGPKCEEYESHDKSASGEQPSKLSDNRKMLNVIGAGIVICIVAYMSRQSREQYVIDRRKQALAEQKAQNERAKELSDA